MIFRILAAFVLLLVFTPFLFSQHQMVPGDTIPEDYVFTRVLNSTKKEIKFGDLKGKPVILDFWATYCGGCIMGLPHLDSLQQEFGDKIQILTIALDDVSKILPRLIQRGVMHQNVLPVPIDTLLALKLTGGVGETWLGEHTWIDKDGVIRHITSGSKFLSKTNLQAFLEGKPLPGLDSLLQQSMANAKSEAHPVILTANDDDNGQQKNSLRPSPLFSSVLSLWAPEMGHANPDYLYFQQENGMRVFRMAGMPLTRLYFYAYGDLMINYPNYYAGNETSYGKLWPVPLIECSDVSSFQKNGEPIKYYYAQMMTDSLSDNKKWQQSLRNILSTNFKYHARVETRNMPCWKLQVKNKTKIPYSKSGETENDESISTVEVNFTHFPVNFLIWQMYGMFVPGNPYIDETHITAPLTMRMPVPHTMKELQKSLSEFGLELVAGKKPMKVIVIGD